MCQKKNQKKVLNVPEDELRKFLYCSWLIDSEKDKSKLEDILNFAKQEILMKLKSYFESNRKILKKFMKK